MAPATSSDNPLLKRYVCYNSGIGDYDDCYSSWNSWGRWVALVVIVVAILVIAFLFSCINSRRRRRAGMAPMYGTGWIPAGNYGPPQGQGQYQYPNQPYGTQNQQYGGYYANKNGGPPAPPYSPPVSHQQTGTSYNSNDGFYGHHQTGGIELQPPQNAHHIPQRGGDEVYEAPLGPPPSTSKKGDAVIR